MPRNFGAARTPEANAMLSLKKAKQGTPRTYISQAYSDQITKKTE
jgi:hypothetical protein